MPDVRSQGNNYLILSGLTSKIDWLEAAVKKMEE
jgi:hypothetical protein